jgi:hypothetical protein
MDTFEPRWTPREETEAEFLERFEQAKREGDRLASTEPCAKAIVFFPENRVFSLTLADGTTIGFAADKIPQLTGASAAALAEVEVIPSGTGLSWRMLDVDLSVSGLVLSLLAAPEWRKAIRQAANRLAAQSASEARTRASRENGKKGGRPRKTATG